MGTDLLAEAETAQLCERCSEATGVDLRRLLTEAADEELRLTQNAQPALFFMGVGLSGLLRRSGIHAAAAAGHSVGEYAALAAAGAIDPVDGIRAVYERSRAMADAAPAGTSSLIAVLGLSPEAVDTALIGVPDAWPANYNTPSQVVVGGTMLGLQRATERLELAGARRVLPLNVSAAFHTSLMEPAAARLRSVLDTLPWRDPEIPVVANLTAQPYSGAAYIAQTLEAQLSSPVRWSGCVSRLLELGCDRFLEVGPKRALTGMMPELAPGAEAVAVATPAGVSELVRTL